MKIATVVLMTMLAGSGLALAGCSDDDPASAEPTAPVTAPAAAAETSSAPLPTATLVPADLITAEAGAELLASDPSVVLIDVRTPEEFAEGHIDGAVNLDLAGGAFTAALDDLDPDAGYVVYCRSGNRSAVAASAMLEAGFTDVRDMGGIQDWVAAGYPTVTGA